MQDPTPLKQAGEDVATPSTHEEDLLRELYRQNTTLAAIGILGLDQGTIPEEVGESMVGTLVKVAEFFGEDYEQVVIARTQEFASELIARSLKG